MRTKGNGQTNRHNNDPIRNIQGLTREKVHGDVHTYFLDSEELAKYRAMKPPVDERKLYVFHGKQV